MIAVAESLKRRRAQVLKYQDAVAAARELLTEQIRDPEGEANPEYVRGICELISDCFGRGSRETVAHDIGLPLESLS